MTSPAPLVSVIIPAFNRRDTILRAVRSVLDQSYSNLECIVVDDGSTDGTAEQLRTINDDRIRLIRHETNRGASAARNTGIRESRAEFIAFLDSDDEWLPSKLARQVPFLLSQPESVGLVYCWMDYVDPAGTVLHQHHPTLSGHVFEHTLDQQRLGGCPTLLLPKSVAEAVGGFDESLPRGNDGDFIRRICRKWAVNFQPEVHVLVHTDAANRISEMTPEGIRASLTSYKSRVNKFSEELGTLPTVHANILRAMAALHSRLGEEEASNALQQQANALARTALSPLGRLSLLMPPQIRSTLSWPCFALIRLLKLSRDKDGG